MVRISSLEERDVERICALMSAKEIKKFYKHKPHLFAQIKSGFRATSLADSEAITLLYQNTNKLFISDYIEHFIKNRLYEIKTHIDRRIEAGADLEEALLKTLPDSIFCDNIDLYFKLSSQEYLPEYVALIEAALRLMKQEDQEKPNDSQSEEMQYAQELRQALDEEKRHRVACETALAAEKADFTDRINQTAQELDSVKDLLAKKQAELDSFYKLCRFQDEQPQSEQYRGFQYVSVCRVMLDHYGKPWLKRLADLHDGKLLQFTLCEDAPRYFENRDRLFWRDGPSGEGAIGIWGWDSVPNQNDPNTDYVTTSYLTQISAIEIRELPECNTLSEVIQSLKNGIPIQIMSERTLFTVPCSDGAYCGVLCHSKAFEFINGIGRLKQTIYQLPTYQIPITHTLLCEKGALLCEDLHLGLPNSLIQVVDPMVAVRDFIISRVSMSQLKLQGLSKKESQHCRDFLSSVATNDVYDEILDAYGCSHEGAVAYVEKFVERANDYLGEQDVEGNILSMVISRNPEMVQRCKQMLEAEWSAENAEKIKEVQEVLRETTASTSRQQEAVERLKKQQDDLQNSLKAICSAIEEKETLALQVEKQVAARIEAARDNAAEFLAEMAFFSSAPSGDRSHQDIDNRSGIASFIRPQTWDLPPKEIVDLAMFEELLEENLETRGYSETRAIDLVQAITFCIAQSLPIVCNTNCEAITDCIASMFGADGATVINLSTSQFYPADLRAILPAKKHSVLLINGALDGFSVNSFQTVLTLSHELEQPILVFSCEGVSAEALPDTVWSRAMYLDGDFGLDYLPSGNLSLSRAEFEFKQDFSSQQIKDGKRQLRPFAPFLSNMSLLHYGCFLAACNRQLADVPILLAQIILRAKATGKQDLILDVMKSCEIDVSCKELARYL